MLNFVSRLLGAHRPRVHTAALLTKTWAMLLLAAWAMATSHQALAQTGAVVTTPQLRAELVAHAPQGVQAGQPLWVGLKLSHQPEWHTYWRNPGDSGLPTQVELNLPAHIAAGQLLWPLPHKLKAGHLTNYGFEKTVLLAMPLTVSKQFKPNAAQTLEIQLHANWLVCRLECIPQEGDFVLRIPVNSSFVPHAAAFDAVLAEQPTTLPLLQATSRFEAQHLVLQVSGWPEARQGQALSVFPDAPELVDSAAEQHAAATQSWQGDVWTVKLPLSPMRMSEPRQFGFLLTAGQGTERQGFALSAPIKQPWPAVSDIPAPTPPKTHLPSTAEEGLGAEGLLGFALALIGAFIGGLILNLMPCVLPVLAIKLLGFAQHSRQHRAHRIAGMAYTTGVVLSFLMLGAGVLALRAAGEQLGWGFQLQSPWVVSVLAAFFMLIALNLFGLFELGQMLPSRLASFQYKHPVLDALLSGVLAVAVASPCTAPFMGASLGLAMTLPTWQALAIFVAMGLGLAAPYLLASLVPAVARLLPHPGPWMVTLRQLLAFPMLATVVWLLWVLGQQTNLDTAMFALGGLLMLAAFVWTLKLRNLASRSLRWLLALALVWGGLTFSDALKAPTDTASNNAATDAQTWQPWSASAVAQSLAQGRPVFIDFTAAWCVTCQINKKSTLSDSEVLTDLATHNVTLMRADWTRRDPAITAALSALGRSGVPVYVLQAPGKPPQVLSELLSVRKMREALATLPSP